MSNTQGSFVDSVIIAARENPIAAALIGGGALWLLIGNEKLKSAASLATTTAFPSSRYGSAPSAIGKLAIRSHSSAADGPGNGSRRIARVRRNASPCPHRSL